MSNLNECLAHLLSVDGAQVAALVDYDSGMLLGSAGMGIDAELAAAGNTEIIRANIRANRVLGFNESIEDILVTLGRLYLIIRPVSHKPGLFFYLILDRQRANLALARRKVQDVEAALVI